AGPIVRHHLLERRKDVFKRVGLNLRQTVWWAEETPAKVVEGTSPLTLTTDQNISFEPNEGGLVIIICWTSHSRPGGRGAEQHLRARRGIRDRAPVPPRTSILEIACHPSQVIAGRRHVPHASARGEHDVAKVPR